MPSSVVAASHHGTLSSGYVTWRSHFVLPSSRSGASIAFAAPIPASLQLVVRQGPAELIRDASGDAIGFRASEGTILDVVVEMVETPTGGVILPLAVGDAVQRITVDGAGDPVLDADRALGIVRHVGFAATGDVSEQGRARCDASLSEHGDAPRRDATYVRGLGELASRGVVGRLSTRGERGHPAEIAALVTFALVVVALLWLARRFQRDARVERAEREIEDAFRDLG